MTIITKASLAAELGITKSRVSQYVKRGLPVRADGKIDREAALHWIKSSYPDDRHERHGGVKRANDIAKRRDPPARKRLNSPPLTVMRSDVLAESMIDRTENWHEIYVEHSRVEHEKLQLDVPEMAALMRVDPDTVLTWLKAGCPFAEEGNWENGEGFRLVPSWAMEWTSLVYSRLVLQENGGALRKLRLTFDDAAELAHV